MKRRLIKHSVLEHSADHIHVEFNLPHKVLSSAVFNGGMTEAKHILNLKVPKSYTGTEAPEITLTNYCAKANWDGTTVAMMTAASMDSFRLAVEVVQGVEIAVLVTTGLSNPRRAGDRAEYRQISTPVKEIGTINIIAMTSANLTDTAMVEALLTVTEAKTAALQDANIISPISNKIATGTGTDSVAMVSGHSAETISYCGKHVLFGEILGRMVTETVASSIEWYQTQKK